MQRSRQVSVQGTCIVPGIVDVVVFIGNAERLEAFCNELVVRYRLCEGLDGLGNRLRARVFHDPERATVVYLILKVFNLLLKSLLMSRVSQVLLVLDDSQHAFHKYLP